MQKNLIITLLFSIVIALFAILNAAAIPVNLIFTKLEVSAALVILISASLGAILIYSLELAGKLRLKKSAKHTQKHYEEQLEMFNVKEKGYLEEIEGLKNELAALEAHVDAVEAKNKAEVVKDTKVESPKVSDTKEMDKNK